MNSMLTFHAAGRWAPGAVLLTSSARSTRRIDPNVERIIEQTWEHVSNRPGVHLFDGPMCRMESFQASPHALRLVLSTTSYKPFVGTNLHNPHLADTYGRDVMANPVGISTLVETADGYLMLGRRNESVAYYPNRVHPFAGALEPRDGLDAFAGAYRELHEELGLERDHITDLRCVGLAEDVGLLQPELIFTARTAFALAEVEQRVVAVEHHAAWPVAAEERTIEAASKDPVLTPVAVASLLLWGRLSIGTAWFERMCRQI